MPSGKLEELDVSSVNLSEQLGELVEFKKQELTRLQQAVLSEQTTLASVKQGIETEKRQAKYDRQVEAEKAHQKLLQEAEGLQAERKSLERLDLELVSRQKDLEQLEAQAEPIKKSMQKLKDERIAIEQQRIRNEELRTENDRLANTTGALHEEVAQLKASLVKEKTRLQTQATEQDQRQQLLEKQQKDVKLQLENLSSLKGSIDPKLAEVTALQAQAEKDRHQAEVLRDETVKRQAELDQQKSDLAILSNQLEAKASALTDFDASLRRTEAEVRIKLQQAKLEGVDVKAPKPSKSAEKP